MQQPEKPIKKPRLKHPDLAVSDLSPEERQRERVRRWRANQKLDPEKVQKTREKNTVNKREQRKRKKEAASQIQQPADVHSQGKAPRKRRRIASPEPQPDAPGPSNSAGDEIPIDPVLLTQETTPATRLTRDVEIMTDMPDPLDAPILTCDVEVMTETLTLMCNVEVMTETPTPMCSVEVMTDIPESLVDTNTLPNDRHPPSPTLSALTELDSRDLATPIIGSQVHAHSETIQWSDGSTTVLPCIMRNGVNVCQDDANSVAFFASLSESLPETSKNVVHLQYSDWRTKSRQLCEEITAALRINKAVVIRQISKPEPATIDLEYLEDRGMSDLMRVVVHDAEQRTKNFTYPHQNATLEEFVNNIHDPNKIQCILDFAYGQGGLPSCLSTLDSSIVNGWNQTTVDCPIGDRVHPDNFLVHSWSLLHGPAYWTNPHHDADGGATFIQIETGEKKWGLWRLIQEDTTTRTNLSSKALELTDLYRNRENILDTWHGEIVTLLPGDMLIQPPGQLHAVYTPVATFATGGHFYNYESMHLTEVSRHIDHKQGKTLTNQIHAHSLETFQRMIVNLPRISRRVKLYSRPLIALCMMVLDGNKYVAAGTEKPKLKTSTTKRAHEIASTVKETNGSNNPMHPGQLITREELLSCLESFTTM
ncbi:hypothetical protein BDR07DRAFT_1488640 [Suillus spraguei]|nr:hypothetical protein BDR07DRAFT_1488640 [Suillus spraguei]